MKYTKLMCKGHKGAAPFTGWHHILTFPCLLNTLLPAAFNSSITPKTLVCDIKQKLQHLRIQVMLMCIKIDGLDGTKQCILPEHRLLG